MAAQCLSGGPAIRRGAAGRRRLGRDVAIPGERHRIGYEEHAYLWTGFGVWTQLWASLVLPLAWGFSWRAIREGRNIFVAVLLVALTIALHFETGYLALIPLVLWPFIAGGRSGGGPSAGC